MSINVRLPNVAAGNPAHGPDSAEPKRNNAATLMRANDVYEDLANGRDMDEVARNCEDPMALGIGAMLAKMSMGGLIREPDRAIGLLDGVFVGESSIGIDLNRRTVVEALQNLGILPRDMSARMAKPAGSLPTLSEICAVIELRTGITLEKIRSASRVRAVVMARFLVIWIMRNDCGYSLADIGGRLGGRDSTSIGHGVRRVKDERDSDMDLRLLIDRIGDQSDLLALKRNRSQLTAPAWFRRNGRRGGKR